MPTLTYPLLVKTATTPGSPGEFLRVQSYYDPADLLNPFTDELDITFSAESYEMATGTEVYRSCVAGRPGDTANTLQVVRYAGNKQLSYDAPLYNSPACPIPPTSCNVRGEWNLVPLDPATQLPTDARTAYLAITTSAYPVDVFLPNFPRKTCTGAVDFVYYTFANPDGTSRPGRYVAQLTDANGCKINTKELVIGTGSGGYGDGDPEDPTSPEPEWLKWSYEPIYGPDDIDGVEPPVGYYKKGTAWRVVGSDLAIKEVYSIRRQVIDIPQDPTFIFYRNVRETIDSYYLADGKTFRVVRHDGKGDVVFEDTVPVTEVQQGETRILNIIKTDVDNFGFGEGRAWIEAETSAPPLTYTLRGGTTLPSNTTGQFQGLSEANYIVRVTDAQGRAVEEAFTIEDRYRPRLVMDIDDYDGLQLKVVILGRDYDGDPIPVCGGEEPVVRGWDGGGTDPLGALPEVLGQRVDLQLVSTEAREFAFLSGRDDKEHRVDVFIEDELVFRGYVAPETYREVLLDGPQYIKVTASDGLGPLSETLFLNHNAEPMTGRRPLLATLLHCLSRTDTNLPLHIGANLREELMAADSEPLLEAWAQRTAYGDKPTCREVLEKILRSFYAFIFQRNGAWWIESYIEVDAFPVHRSFTMEGLPLLPAAIVPGAWHIVAPDDVENPLDLHWVEATQSLEIVPAAAVVESKVSLQLVKNLLQNGDFLQWTADKARPLYWSLVGNPFYAKGDGEKVGQYALQLFPRITQPVNSGLLSSNVQVFEAPDESPLRLSITARVPKPYPTIAVPKPPARIIRLQVQVLANGVPLPDRITFEFTSDDKKDTQETFLPVGLSTGSVRLKVLPIELVTGAPVDPADQVTLFVDTIALDIVPSLREWPDEDNFFAFNAERGYVQLPTIELTHTDMPRLPLANGLPATATAMDVLAWRHALSHADNTPTERWKRPTDTEYQPILETAAIERMELRTVPGQTLIGAVQGPLVHQLGVGSMLDAVNDADGKYLVIACQHAERPGTAQITARYVRDGSYTVVTELTGRVRWTEFGPRYTSQRGYRTTSG